MEQRISIERMEEAVNLFGSFDENIRLLETEFQVQVVNRGGEIVVSGEPENVMLAVKAVQALLTLSNKGENISDQHVRYVIGLVRSGQAERISELTQDVICITSKGRPVKPKTIGQKEYVNAIMKQTVTIGGILKSRRQKITKKNEIMAFCVLEDLQGECELIVFPSALEKLSPLLSEGAVLLVTGTAQLREAVSEDGEDELKLLVRTARRAEPDGTAAEAEKPARTRAGVYLKITADNEKALDEALEELRAYPGGSAVFLYYEKDKKLLAAKQLRVAAADGLLARLRELLGGANVAVREG